MEVATTGWMPRCCIAPQYFICTVKGLARKIYMEIVCENDFSELLQLS